MAKQPNTVRMADGLIATTSGTTTFEARIGTLDIKFEATILYNLYCDALLGHDFLVDNEVSWDYAACTIHMGKQIRTSTCWKGKSQPPTTIPDLSQLEFGNDTEMRAKLTAVLNKYAVVFTDKVGRTKLIEHEILLKNPTPIALKPYPYPQQKQIAIDDMVRDMETLGLACPMPDLNKMIRQMLGAKILSIFDLRSG